MFGPSHDYKIGDDAWLYVGDHQGRMSKGKVVALLDLPGYAERHYVVEIDTSLLEVRNSATMRPVDPRVTSMAGVIAKRYAVDAVSAEETAIQLLAIADDE